MGEESSTTVYCMNEKLDWERKGAFSHIDFGVSVSVCLFVWT